VIADDDHAFITSATFTEWAQQRHVEAGVLIRDRHFTGQLRQQFDGLVQSTVSVMACTSDSTH
jgi:phosphatidylserine/phosphatidylglycerophosphate/cardiolipin synthase-like enzyme